MGNENSSLNNPFQSNQNGLNQTMQQFMGAVNQHQNSLMQMLQEYQQQNLNNIQQQGGILLDMYNQGIQRTREQLERAQQEEQQQLAQLRQQYSNSQQGTGQGSPPGYFPSSSPNSSGFPSSSSSDLNDVLHRHAAEQAAMGRAFNQAQIDQMRRSSEQMTVLSYMNTHKMLNPEDEFISRSGRAAPTLAEWNQMSQEMRLNTTRKMINPGLKFRYYY